MGFVDFLDLKNKNKNTKTDATLTAQGERWTSDGLLQ